MLPIPLLTRSSHTLMELLQFLILCWFSEYEQMLMHNHQKIRLHGLLHPIRSALALPLMFYYVFPQDKPNLQERLEGPKSHRHIVQVPSCIPNQDRAEVVGF